MKQWPNLPSQARWAVPAGAVAVAGGVLAASAIPAAQAAPLLPPRTPAQLLAAVAGKNLRVGEAEVSAQLADDQPERICAELVGAGVGVRGLGVITPSLEELFVGLTGEGFDIDG